MADALICLSQKENTGIKILLAGRSIERLQNQFGIHDNVKFLSYDLNAPIKFNEPVDYVIHVAGNAHPAAFNGDPVGTIVGNVDSTYRLLEYTKNHGGKDFFIYLQVKCTDKETFLLMLLMRHIQGILIYCQLGRAIH